MVELTRKEALKLVTIGESSFEGKGGFEAMAFLPLNGNVAAAEKLERSARETANLFGLIMGSGGGFRGQQHNSLISTGLLRSASDDKRLDADKEIVATAVIEVVRVLDNVIDKDKLGKIIRED